MAVRALLVPPLAGAAGLGLAQDTCVGSASLGCCAVHVLLPTAAWLREGVGCCDSRLESEGASDCLSVTISTLGKLFLCPGMAVLLRLCSVSVAWLVVFMGGTSPDIKFVFHCCLLIVLVWIFITLTGESTQAFKKKLLTLFHNRIVEAYLCILEILAS